MNDVLKAFPSVCLAGNEYLVFVPVNAETLMWIDIGGKKYYDESNGILRSAVKIHKMIVPKDDLDKAKRYKLCYRKVIERKVYFPLSEDTVEIEFVFRPIEKEDNINIVMIADSHGMIDPSTLMAKKATDSLDLLILNGDIADHSGSEDNIAIAYQIAGNITKGEIPVVFSRGNHDMRGACAERLADFTPNVNGKTYYSFKVGPVWGLVLDCGEDKDDWRTEYGYTICCHDYRVKETEFIKNIIKNSSGEYALDDVKYKLVISHVPFCLDQKDKDQDGFEVFNIEHDLFCEWAKLLKDNIKPNLMLTGHMHYTVISEVGSEYDDKGQPCTCVIGSNPDFQNRVFTGTLINLHGDEAQVSFVSSKDGVISKEQIKW